MAPPPLTFYDFDRLGRELLESGWAGRADETAADLRRRERAEAIALDGGGEGGGGDDGGGGACSSVRADAAAAHEAASGLRGAAPLRPARVLEVVGPTGSGKSELLHHVAARFLVSTALAEAERRRRQRRQQQRRRDEQTAAGDEGKQQEQQQHHHQQHAVLLDMDGKLSLDRLLRVAGAHAKAAYRAYAAAVAAEKGGGGGGGAGDGDGENEGEREQEAAAAEAEALLTSSALLQRLHVAQPRSSLELLATLAALPERMARVGGRWRLLLMDGAAAFAWHDRAAGQGGAGAGAGSGGGPADGGGGPALSHTRAQTAAADLVAALGERLRVATVVTRRARVTRQPLGGSGGGGRRRSSDEGGGGGWPAAPAGFCLVAAEQPAPRWQALVAQRLVLAPPPPLQAALAQRLAVPGSAMALLAQWQQAGGQHQQQQQQQRQQAGGGGGGGGGAGGAGGAHPPPPPVGLWALDDGRLVEGDELLAANKTWQVAFA